MAFYGAVEAFGRARVSGWVRCEAAGARLAVALELRLRGHDPIAPAALSEREEGTGFVFTLPEVFRAMPWAGFVDAYEGVLARAEGEPGPFRVPMYKSVLLGPDLVPVEADAVRPAPGNPTTLLAERLRDYATGPVTGGRVAAFTLAQDDALLLGLWARHHAAAFGAGNCYVLDPGGAGPACREAGVNLVPLAEAPRDGWQAVRMLALFQRFLLESYDSAVVLDPDMLLCADPALAGGRSLAEVIAALPAPVAAPSAWKLWHDIEGEGEYDPARPLLAQRRILVRDRALDRALIARLPMNWRPGLAGGEAAVAVDGLHALHLRSFDLDHALATIPRLSGGAIGAEQVVGWFRTETRAYRTAVIRGFDTAAPRTMVPEWMARAIAV